MKVRSKLQVTRVGLRRLGIRMYTGESLLSGPINSRDKERGHSTRWGR